MKDREGPQLNVCDVRPMDGRVMQHCSGNGHDCGDSSFSNSVGVMGSNTGVADVLMKFFKMCFKVLVDKRGAVVAEELLRDYSVAGTHLVEPLLGVKGCV